jgi:ketosteroid isomerase-like protein
VKAFYDAFNSHDFSRAVDFTTDDWTHINPMGGWTRGREAVLNELKEVHATFLKGVSDTPEEMSVNFATPDVAVVTVPSRVSTLCPMVQGTRTSAGSGLSYSRGGEAGG